MTVEINVGGQRCGADNGGLSCAYCYLPNSARHIAQPRIDHVMIQKALAATSTKSFTLFGGEALLAPVADLERLWAYGLKTYKANGVQTSGRPITPRHMELFRKYNVCVGFSIDGPGMLNDPRWAGSVEATRAATQHSITMLEELLAAKHPVTLLVTLHKANASRDRLPLLLEWFGRLGKLGLASCGLHLLEHTRPLPKLEMTPAENLSTLLRIWQWSVKADAAPPFTLFRDVRALLKGQDAWKWNDGTDAGVKCCWAACDPWMTPSVYGIEADGSRSLCQRMLKEGGVTTWQPVKQSSLVRQLALATKPKAEGGCSDCRYMILCKGQCPGAAIDGDWRLRNMDCETWSGLFDYFETALLTAGEQTVTTRPDFAKVVEAMTQGWRGGHNLRVLDAIAIAEGRQRPRAGETLHRDHNDHRDHQDLSGVLKGGERVS